MKLLLITFSLFTVSCSLFTSKKEDKKSKSVNLSTYNALTPKDFVELIEDVKGTWTASGKAELSRKHTPFLESCSAATPEVRGTL